MFFSEEKNQKTFLSGAAQTPGPWPAGWELRPEIKSLLLLFFRKEDLFFLMRRGVAIWAWTAIILLNAPIVVVVIMSFSAGAYLSFPPAGLSLHWYGSYIHSPRWMLATFNSLRLAFATVAVATPLGVLGSFGLMRGRFRLRRLSLLLVNIPLLLPGVVAAIGMYFFFARLGLIGSFWSILLAHVCLVVPIVVISTNAALETFDQTLELAAAGLGANRLRSFWWVTRPLIQPGILTGMLFAFLLSFDELPVALFLTGTDGATLPVRMWSNVRDEMDPTLAAVSTLLVALCVAAILATQFLQRRGPAGAGPSRSDT
jgi:putative spermidine/putrescine transport system permease protein